jgi:hypothetical protein
MKIGLIGFYATCPSYHWHPETQDWERCKVPSSAVAENGVIPFTAILSQPLTVSSKEELNDLDYQLDRRVAALFVHHKIYLANDCSNWRAAVKQLAHKLIERFEQHAWLSRVFSDCCCTWKLVTAVARKEYNGFRTQAEIAAAGSGAHGKYSANPDLLRTTVEATSGTSGLSISQTYLLLELWSAVGEILYMWFLDTPDKELPDELESMAATIWGPLSEGQRKEKLQALAASLLALRPTLDRFGKIFGKAEHLRDRLKEQRQRAKKQPKELLCAQFAEGPWLREKIERSLAAIPKNTARLRRIAVVVSVEIKRAV